MMAEKAKLFNDTTVYQQIITSTKPGKVKELGRNITNFNQKVWEENRYQIVVKGNFHKFSQNQKLSDFLKNTKNRILVEASPLDSGLAQENDNISNPTNWNGLNLLGHALMEVRDMLLMQ